MVTLLFDHFLRIVNHGVNTSLPPYRLANK